MTRPRQAAPSPLQAQFALAYNFQRQGKFAEAEAGYRAILKSHHRHFDSARMLGMVLLQQGALEAAEKQIGRALKFRDPAAAPQSVAETFNTHAVALIQLRRFGEALASIDAALAVAPRMAGLLANRGWALLELERFAESLAACDSAIALDPRFAPVHHTRARALSGLNRFAEALAGFNQAIALQPDYHDAFYERSFCHLRFGQFGEGWDDAEHRRYISIYRERNYALGAPETLTRADLVGKRVLVLAEQGIGDEIMFAGMVPDIMRDAAHVALECDPRLLGLFARSFPGVELIARHTPGNWDVARYDHVLHALSLGRIYRRTPADFPQRASYLTPGADIVKHWQDRITALEGVRIGISWQGGTEQTRRSARSIALEHWTPLLTIPGASFVSLQYGHVKDQIQRANAALPQPITCFDASRIDDFDQLAALTASLDMVVSVQTALAHLCGAMGKTCHVMVPQVAEWRYGFSGNRLPWYGSVELHRQSQDGDWSGPLVQVANAVRALTAARQET